MKQQVKTKKQTIASIKRHRTAKMAKIAARAVYLQKKGQVDEMATFICEELLGLGGVYVKFLQGVMLQSEFFKRWDSPNRYNVFENLDTEMISLTEMLSNELPKSKLALIAQVQPEPFAAGSFGQVYFGYLRDGSPVIIKVLRPLIRETLAFDLKLIGILSKQFFTKMYGNMDVNYNTAISEFRKSTLNETDYVAEARFAAEMYEAYKGHPKFVIPKTYTELCTPNIIVQEYIGGISGAQLVKLKEQGIEPINYVYEKLGSNLDAQLSTMGYEYVHGMFTIPRVQGDPHPGNVKFLDNDRVALIDFGIIAPAPRDQASFFALLEEYAKLYEGKLDIEELFGKFLRFFANDMYKAFKRLHDVRSDSSEDLTKTIGKLAKKAFTSQMKPSEVNNLGNDNNMLMLINQVVNKDNKFGLVLNVQSTEILRAAQTYIALVEAMGRSKEVLPKMFRESVDQIRRDRPELSIESTPKITINAALNTVTKWLERVAERDPILFRKFMAQIRGGNLITEDSKDNATEREKLNV